MEKAFKMASFVFLYSKICVRENENSHLQQYTLVSSVKLYWNK